MEPNKERKIEIINEIKITLDRINLLLSEISDLRQESELMKMLDELKIFPPVTESVNEFQLVPLPVRQKRRSRKLIPVSNKHPSKKFGN